MTMLTVVQNFCRRTGISVPTTVFGSTDNQIQQIMALLEEEGTDLSGRGAWQRITFESTHASLAAESQGTIDSIATNNFRYFKSETSWDRTENLPLLIIDGQDWQAEKGFSTTSPRFRIRVRGGELLATPTPPAGNTWAHEYVSWNWILDNNGTTYKQYFTEDTDELLLPEPILLQGLRWRWKKEKGLDYEEDFYTYERMADAELGRQGLKKALHMDAAPYRNIRGIYINEGNWPL